MVPCTLSFQQLENVYACMTVPISMQYIRRLFYESGPKNYKVHKNIKFQASDLLSDFNLHLGANPDFQKGLAVARGPLCFVYWRLAIVIAHFNSL